MNKKSFFSLLLMLFSVATVFGQAPQAFNFQAVVRDNNGVVLSEQTVGIMLTILQGSATGTRVYEETFQIQTDKAGVVSLPAGKGTVTYGNFAEIRWQTGAYYLNLSVRLPNSSQSVNLGALQLLSVPYALYAAGPWSQTAIDDSPVTYINSFVSINNESGKPLAVIMESPKSSGNGGIGVYGNDGNGNAVRGLLSSSSVSSGSNLSYGIMGLIDEDSETKLVLGGTKESGTIGLFDADDRSSEFYASDWTSYQANGNFSYYLCSATDGQGVLGLFGPAGKPNIVASSLSGYPNNGYIGVYSNTNENNWGALYMAANGRSVLIADEIYNSNGVKLLSTTQDYTSQARSGTATASPCYVTSTGDGQIIARGTATLTGGKCTVTLPAGVAAKIREHTITVQLTPLSAVSKGLAVTGKQAGVFAVAELASGTGAYEFDWTLTAFERDESELRSKVLKEIPSVKSVDKPTQKNLVRNIKEAAALQFNAK